MEHVTRMKLTAQNVENVLKNCLYKADMDQLVYDGPNPQSPLMIEGIVNKFEFNPEMIAQEKSHIEQMLDQLPECFFKEGWTFGEMFYNRHGDVWTGIIHPMEHLLALGLAIGKISYTAPRTLWWSLPGGMPCVKVAAS